MYTRFKTQKTKSYGNGFDTLGLADDGRAFRAWWNAMSTFPVPASETGPVQLKDYLQAA
ncbi:MAG: hypothetical protein ACP5DX_09070 [Paracoccaceae bacterium]